MAIIDVREINPGRATSVEYPTDGIVKKQFKRIFQVDTDNAEDDGGAIRCEALSRNLIPQFYNPYITANFSDLDCLCKSINADPTESQYTWTITCSFDNDPYQPANSPLCLPPIKTTSFQRTKEAVEFQINGQPPLNSALIPVAMEKDRSLPNLQFKWCSINYDDTILLAIEDMINAKTWRGYPPGTLKLDGFTVTEQIDPYRAGQGLLSPNSPVPGRYYEKNISLSVKYEGWQPMILDAGLYELDPDHPPVPGRPPRWRPIRDDTGQPVQQPVPLDGFGHKLPFGRQPIYKTYLVYRPVDFDDITDPVFGKTHYGKLIDWPSVPCPERDSLVCN